MAFAATATVRCSSSKLNKLKPKLSWLDLRGMRLSALERLCLEEVLLRHGNHNGNASGEQQDHCWALVGTHEPTTNRILRQQQSLQDENETNKSCVIIMGIGGKPQELLNMDLVKRDGLLVIKRFSGGGTVVLDHDSLWTTFIGRNSQLAHAVQPFPRPIMKWTANAFFEPAFASLSKQATSTRQQHPQRGRRPTLVMDTKSCSATENIGKVLTLPDNTSNATGDDMDIPDFGLVETDYVLGERKCGGNAQSIVKGGWLHHTSFLWDYQDEHMEYLSLPTKRPKYRGSRSHEDFLVKLKTHYGGELKQNDFFSAVKEACANEFQVQDVTYREAMAIVNKVGGLQSWFDEKSRNKIVTLV